MTKPTTPTTPAIPSDPEGMPDDATLAEIGREVLSDVQNLRERAYALREKIRRLTSDSSEYSKMSPTFVDSLGDAQDHERLRDAHAALADILKRLAVLRDYEPSPRASHL